MLEPHFFKVLRQLDGGGFAYGETVVDVLGAGLGHTGV